MSSQYAWTYIAHFLKRRGQLTMRVPLPFQVLRGEPPKVWVKDGYLMVEWQWGKKSNPLVESERPFMPLEKGKEG